MKENIFGIILAGGIGSRLWPLSREMFPKQMLKLTENSNDTLFQQTIKLLKHHTDIKNILAVTNIKLEKDLQHQYKEIASNNDISILNMLIEPAGKNTASAIISSILHILSNNNVKKNNAIFIVMPSDHLITNKAAFYGAIENAIKLAKEDCIVTLGVFPDKPETSFGYIRVIDPKINNEYYKAISFKEKPSLEKAKEYIADGNYYWNSGIFIFKADFILNEFNKHCPEICKILNKMSFKNKYLDYEQYNLLPEISIDYALMEKSEKIVLIPIDVGWNDIGNWSSVSEYLRKDSNGNFISGNVIAKDCKNSLIYGSDNMLAAIGLNNKVIVSTEDATLICDKNKTQDIQKVYQELKNKDDSTYKVHKTIIKPWGYITLLRKEDTYNIVSMCMKPGCSSNMHMHFHKNKHWTIVEGVAKVVIENKEYYYMAGQSLNIMATEKHMFSNPGTADLVIIEVQTGEYLLDNDIAQFDD